MRKLLSILGIALVLPACGWYIADADPPPSYVYEPVCRMPFDYSPYSCYENCCYWDIPGGEEMWCSYDDCTWTFRDETSFEPHYAYEPYCETDTYYYDWYYYCESTWCLCGPYDSEWCYSSPSVCCDEYYYPAECWYE